MPSADGDMVQSQRHSPRVEQAPVDDVHHTLLAMQQQIAQLMLQLEQRERDMHVQHTIHAQTVAALQEQLHTRAQFLQLY